jgi:hypothetical protein
MAGDVAEAEDREQDDGAANRGRFSSVVYFHGMGSQRRYEETSRLVDSLDRHLVGQHHAGNSIGMLLNIKTRVEPLTSAVPTTEIVGYIRTVFKPDPKGPTAASVRFYEAYWAPVMAANKSAWGVAKWLFRQPLRPWHTLRAPWRERQRLRRATLVALFEKDRNGSRSIEERDYTSLMGLYNDFEGLDAQRKHRDGTFEDFLSFIAERSKSRPETAKRRAALAKAWHAAYWRQELRNAALLTCMTLSLALLVGGVLFGILLALQSALAFGPIADLLAKQGEPPKADWKTVLAVAGLLASLVGVTKFLTDYLGDVEAWATYEETDIKHVARKRVLDQGMELLTHVLKDPNCERVTIVAHSLGTSIAHDTLLALTRRNEASNPKDPFEGPVPLHKIEHFVTMGSPIDKIEYFFESFASASHRYKRVIEALRGDIGAPPFTRKRHPVTRKRHPHIHWINFWDQGDAISGALHSPASAVEFCQRVDNVHVASYRFPEPGASHAGYFTHRTVIDALFKVIYHRAWSFEALAPPAPNQAVDFESVHLGPGEPPGIGRSIYMLMALAVPLLVLFGLLAGLVGLSVIGYAALGGAASLLILLLVAWLGSRATGQRNQI